MITTSRLFRLVFICATGFVTAHAAFAAGAFQKTKDQKTIVWNNAPAPGDQATWTGERDSLGYATGEGTLTWYTGVENHTTGTNIPTTKHAKLSRFTGTMVKGKLEGPVVAVDADGKTYHGTFLHGHRTADWTEGAPTDKPKKAATPAPSKSPAKAVAKPSASPAANPSSTPAPAATPPSEETPHESSALDSLTRPPSSLRANPEPRPADEAPPVTAAPAGPTLTTGEAIELADNQARTKGIDLHGYRRPQAQYIAADDAWSVFYDQKSEDGKAEAGKHFTVQVEDKTKKVNVIPGR